MESYKVAEEQILTELPTKYPQLFELFVLIKTLLNISFGTKFDGDSWCVMFAAWIIGGAISVISIMVCMFNDQYDITLAYMGVPLIMFVLFVIHMVMGRAKS